MSSDIFLEKDAVIVKGDTLKSESHDFNLDNMQRRRNGCDPNKLRRALVHDFNDGLTINYDQDYPGGVNIRALDSIEANPSNPACPGSITVNARVLNCRGTDILLDSEERRNKQPGTWRRALVHDFKDTLTVNYGNDYTGGVKVEGSVELTGSDVSIGGTKVTVDKSSGTVGISKKLEVDGSVVVSNKLKYDEKAELSSNIIKISNVGGMGWESVAIQGHAITVSWNEQTGPASAEPRSLELISTIKELQNTVEALSKKISEIESKLNT